MDPEELAAGTVCKMPSGLGGIFQMEYQGQAQDGRFVFFNKHKGWQHRPWSPRILNREQVIRLISYYI